MNSVISHSSILVKQSRNVFLFQVRNAGGGGRPGGKPTFNWKQRNQLELSKTGEIKKPFKFGLSGNFDDLKNNLNELQGDKIVDILKMKSFKSGFNERILKDDSSNFELSDAKLYENDDNRRKQINISMLFGSNKTYGSIEKKHKIGNFSHKRVFGNKEKQVEEIKN